ncbi:hypothetical protein MPTK1_4g03040 [Marchantia polymorpha subsp. ruderalis]|nr:hypothetical protein MARPO_0172s0022 [Marchantia polymorpha]BBN07342.1 hypothetical protein Mp_4g03040 [Marchantia polymorpha subsp. ruderalis]|eukprot:PTQ28155.1 hypothetical protein MARPO_0172s0022 [Marchantia polymorpha]
MGWRKKDSQPVPFRRETSIMPQRKQIERSPSAIFKLVCYTLFDVSPASAFLDSSGDAIRGLPALTPSKKHSRDPSQKHLRYSSSLPVQRLSETQQKLGWSNSLHVQRSSSSDSDDSRVEKHTSNSDSGAGSPIHGGGKLFKVFRRKSSKSKIDIHVASQSNLSSPDRSNGDIDYNGDISSNSLFEIQVERSADINRNYNDEENFSDPQLVQRLASEVVLLRKRLDEGEQEVKKLKDEVSSLRSSSASSQVESPRSDMDRVMIFPESLAFDKYEDSRRARSQPGSSSTSTSDKYDGDSKKYMEFCTSDQGQLVKLVHEEHPRSRVRTPQVSDDEESVASSENDVILVRRSSLSAEDLDHYTSQIVFENQMNMFLSDATAALGKRGFQENYVPKFQFFDSHLPEGVERKSIEETEEEARNAGMEVNDDSRGVDSKLSLELVQTGVTGSHKPHVQSLGITDEKVSNNGTSVVLVDEEHGGLSAERTDSTELRADSEWSSREFDDHVTPQKKKGMSIMEFGVPADPEIAERRRQVQLRFHDVEEKLMKILRSPRRDYSSRSTSYSSSSASSSGTSSPQSLESGSPLGSFRDYEHTSDKLGDICDKDCYGVCCFPSEEIVPAEKSDVQASRKNPVRDLDLELSSPRDVLFSNLKSNSLAKTRSLPSIRSEIWEEEPAMSFSGTPEVYFHPDLSKDLTLSVLADYQQQIDCAAAEEISSGGDLYRYEGKSAETGVEESVVAPVPDEHAVVAYPVQQSSSGDMYGADHGSLNGARRTRRTRFGEEAARLALQRSSSDVPGGSRYAHTYPK